MINIFFTQMWLDLKKWRRDTLMSFIFILAIFFIPLIRILLPFVSSLLQARGIDLYKYSDLIASFFFIGMIPGLFGIVIGFFLLDERDERTLTALQVTPLPLDIYIWSRFALCMGLSLAFSIFGLPLVGLPMPANGLISLLPAVALSSFQAPVFGLSLFLFAGNKVEAIAVMKFLNIFWAVPVVAYFVPGVWHFAFGLLPAYWPMKTFWMLYSGQSGASIYFLVGLIFHLLLVLYLLARFKKQLSIHS